MKTTHPSSQTNTLHTAGIRNKSRFQIAAVLVLATMFALTQSAGAAAYTWNVSSGNWSTPANWNPNTGLGGPLAGDSLTFANTGASGTPFTINNTVDASFNGTASSLTYSDIGLYPAWVYPTTFIPANETLTVSGNFVVGGQSQTGGYGSFADFVGGGTLNVTAPSFIIGNGGSGAGAVAVLDLSGLTNFVYNNTNGSIGISTNGGPLAGFTRISGTMTLASGSNYITAGSLSLGTSTSAQGGAGLITSSYFGGTPATVQNNTGPVDGINPGVLTLGPGTNIINTGAIVIANQKYGFIITNSGGGLRIRGITGADSDANVNITVGDRNVSGGSGSAAGFLLLDGCPVDIKANSLILGERVAGTSNGANNGDGGSGLLQFDDGTISANSLQMADNAGNNDTPTSPSVANGLIQVGAHGTFLIGAGQLFALATATGTGPASGYLVVSNGLINCQGPIVMGPCTNSIPPSGNGQATGVIQLIGSGTLSMGPNSYIGSLTNPITDLILDSNSVFSISIPSPNYTNVCVDNLSWPTNDANLTIGVAAIPAGITNNEVFPFLNFTNTTTTNTVVVPGFTTANNTTVTITPPVFTNPKLVLPIGVSGNLSLPAGNTIYLTITGGAQYAGANQLLNPFFVSGATDWTPVGGASLLSTNSTYPNTGGCTVDTRHIVTLTDPRTGTNVAKLTGSFIAGGSTNTWSQSVPIAAGSTVTAGAFTYVAHEDIMSGADTFYYELDFRDTNGNLVAAYESSILTNLNCGSPILDTWNFMSITNQMQVSGGVNTGVVISNVAQLIQVPPQTVTGQLKAVFIQRNATDSGSVYFTGGDLGFISSPVPPTVSSITPNHITLCTNAFLTCTASSTETVISDVQVIATTTTLGGTTTNITTYNIGSSGLTVTGLGTSSANISLALTANTIYQSVVVNVTDADNVTVSSSAASFDTLTPVLVIEAADFNYSSGQFMDTPANGGLALYQGKIGTQGIDENVGIVSTNAHSYYRTNDAVLVGNANPQDGNPPSSTEQKFVSAFANGDTLDVEQCISYNSVGDWLNYTRTYGSGGSAPAGTYNIWCYLATADSGVQSSFSLVTSNPAQTNQTTSLLGYFGTTAFTDGGFNDYVYTPLVDSFGNRISVTLPSGQTTFKSTVVGNPNLGFYMLVPAVPIYTPVLLNVSPNGPYQPADEFTFTVGPANGAAISTNGISFILNGVAITSGLNFTQVGGNWVVTYAIQSNATYTAVIDVTNTSGYTLNSPYTVSFDTFDQNNFTIEAGDFDFNGGQWIDDPIETAPNVPDPNSYYGYPGGSGDAVYGVDFTTTNVSATETYLYRLDGSDTSPGGFDAAGTEVTSDLLRNKFVNTGQVPNEAVGTTNTDYDVGWWSPGTWLNYTRTFPTNTYNVWGRLANSSPYSGATMSLVTSGQGTTNQTTQVLGTFSDPNANGFQSWHWVPLTDTNGQPVTVSLGGVETLKVTAPPGNATGSMNAHFYMFVPYTSTAVSPFLISASVSAGTVSIKFPTQSTHNYTVQYSSSLNPASWQTLSGGIAGDGTMHTVTDTTGGAQRFYRVLAQ